ncbi:MAG TPA: EamA family transporter [Acidimicrobiales bacterium]|nr:EamA family transporter [Acidimicrobiales bacterium]
MTGLAIAWALLTALAFGAADFLGGLASRRVPVLPVVLVSQIVAVVLLAVSVVLVPGTWTAAALGWGTAAGAAAGLAFLAYYRGLAVGRMGLVSTMAAVWSAVVPVVVGLTLGGERPAGVAVAGIGVAIVAITLLSSGEAAPGPAPPGIGAGGTVPALGQPGLVEGVLAGIGFGGFFVFIERTGTASATWPLLAAATATTVVVGVVALVRGADLRLVRGHLRPVVAAGVLQVVGGLAVVLAMREGLLSLVAVLAALSPLPTMLLARVVLAELLTGRQLGGICLGLLGVVLIAAA